MWLAHDHNASLMLSERKEEQERTQRRQKVRDWRTQQQRGMKRSKKIMRLTQNHLPVASEGCPTRAAPWDCMHSGRCIQDPKHFRKHSGH